LRNFSDRHSVQPFNHYPAVILILNHSQGSKRISQRVNQCHCPRYCRWSVDKNKPIPSHTDPWASVPAPRQLKSLADRD
jgi:hypothetical protein